MLAAITPRKALWLVFAITLATILGAWGFQYMGYEPCELCLMQRWAYYTVVPLSLVLALVAGNNVNAVRAGLILLGLLLFVLTFFVLAGARLMLMRLEKKAGK